MDKKDSLKDLSHYLYHLMIEGVEPKDFGARIYDDISLVCNDKPLMIETILEVEKHA